MMSQFCSFPSPRSFVYVFTSDLLVTRTLMVQRPWYGFSCDSGVVRVAFSLRATAPPGLP